MAKYDALRSHLTRNGEQKVRMTFAQIAEIVGGLPKSAYQYQAWWANEDQPMTHVQKQAWIAAGYVVEQYDLSAKWVRFVRRR